MWTPLRDHQVEAHAGLASPSEQRALGQRQEARRHGENQALRQQVQLAVFPDVALSIPLRGADEAIAEAELATQRGGLRTGQNEGVGAAVDHESIASLGLDVPAEARSRFDE